MDNVEAWDLEIGLLGLVGTGSASDDTLQRLELQGCLEFAEPFLREAGMVPQRALQSVSVMMACEIRCVRDHYASVQICGSFSA